MAASSFPVPFLPFPISIPDAVQALHDANSTRYLSAVGMTVFLYDYLLSFSDEIKLVWTAPRSFAKYAYLFNRYLVMICLLAVTHEICGFVGDVYSDFFLFALSMLSLVSVATANILILLRVVLLWDHRPIIVKLMTAGFIACFSTQATLMVLTLVDLYPGVFWVPQAGMCITSFTSPKLIGVWASPMLFEVLVLLSTILNAMDRPHQAELPISKTLYRDGVLYFFAVTCFRTFNLTLSVVGRPSTSMLGVFFTWAMVATVLSRSLLNIREQEIKSDVYTVSGRASPFNMRTEVDIYDMEAVSPSFLELKKMRSV